jgi:hypothetical protein
MVRRHLTLIPRLMALLAIGIVAAACLTVSGCAASSGRVSVQPTPTCGAALISATTLSIPERITALAEQASCNQLHDLTATYQQPGGVAQITGTVSGAIPRTPSQISVAQERVKTLCFQVERALWTSTIPVQEVTVTVLGTVYDDYFDQVISWYGTASLGAKAAPRFDWRSLSADQAWTLFDRTLLRVDYDSFQLWGGTPGPSSSPGNS